LGDLYWFEDAAGAAGDNLLGSNNWNDQTDSDGSWGTPGVGDDVYMETDYEGGVGGCDEDCIVAASVTLDSLTQNLPAGNPYEGTFTVSDGKTLTVTTCEFESSLVLDGDLDVNGDFQSFATHTGAGGITVGGEVNMGDGVDWSGYTGTLTFDGSASKELTGSSGPPLSVPNLTMNGTGTLTADKRVSAGDITMTDGTLDVTLGLSCDDVTVDGGTLNLGGLVSMGDLSGTGGTVDVGSAYVEMAADKTLDFDSVTVTNTAGVVLGGTVDNMDLTGETVLEHYFPATAGTGNTNVTEVDPLYEVFHAGVYAGVAA